MNSSPLSLATLAVALALPTHAPDRPPPAPRVECAELIGLQMPDVRITLAAMIDPRGAAGVEVTVPHCRVEGVIGREIRFEVLLPTAWNERFFMGGGGGFVGSIQNGARFTVNQGYASAGTDTGHQGSTISAEWALANPERVENFGHLAIHRTAETAKAIITRYYGAAPRYSYFLGCSRGGGQALMEAQRYPEDFDGIVAGAPALDWTGFAAEMVQNVQAAFTGAPGSPTPVLTTASLRLLEGKVLEACDALDGVRDGVMEDPRSCAFDLASIPPCPGEVAGPACFTTAQRAAIRRVYAPAMSNGRVVSPGQPFGGEGADLGWRPWITGASDAPPAAASSVPGSPPSLAFAFGTQLFKNFVFGDPAWDHTRYDFSTWEQDTRATAAILNATDPDLGAFKASGGKLILWHGWSDPALSATRTVQYYEAVGQRDPGVREYARLFLLPGVLHCAGGAGPDQVNWVAEIVGWVERGVAPERVIATRPAREGSAARTRPLCPYPRRAVYLGAGSTDDASGFACREP